MQLKEKVEILKSELIENMLKEHNQKLHSKCEKISLSDLNIGVLYGLAFGSVSVPVIFAVLFLAEYYFNDYFIPRAPGDLILFVFCIFIVFFLLANLCDYIKTRVVKNKAVKACKNYDVGFFSLLMKEPDHEKESKYILKIKNSIRELKPNYVGIEKLSGELSDYISEKRLQKLIEEAEISHLFDKNKGISYYNLFHVLNEAAKEDSNEKNRSL